MSLNVSGQQKDTELDDLGAAAAAQVAGVDNKVARYREDRQLAPRHTPFAERCAPAVHLWLERSCSVGDLPAFPQLI